MEGIRWRVKNARWRVKMHGGGWKVEGERCMKIKSFVVSVEVSAVVRCLEQLSQRTLPFLEVF